MKVMLDTNIALDILQQREPHQQRSAEAVSAVVRSEIQGCFPAHAVTTVYYVLRRVAGQAEARRAAGWLVNTLEIAPCDGGVLTAAIATTIADLEDAVVACSAREAGCDYIVTRNKPDFSKSPVPAISPEELLGILAAS